MKTTKHLEEGSGREAREDSLEGGCPKLSKVERQSASNCKKNRVNSAISAKATTPDKYRITSTKYKIFRERNKQVVLMCICICLCSAVVVRSCHCKVEMIVRVHL